MSDIPSTQLPPPQGPPIQYGFWGPETPKTPVLKPWGMDYVGWGALFLIVSQIVLVPVLVIIAMFETHIDFQSPDAVQQFSDAISKAAALGPGILVGLISEWVVFFGVPYAASRRRGDKSLARDFGLKFHKTDPFIGIGIAIGMQVLGIGLSALFTLFHSNLSGADNTTMVTNQAGIFLILMTIAAALGAPLFEELFFRGLLMRAFLRKFAHVDLAKSDRYQKPPLSPARQRLAVVGSIALTAIIFGIMHAPASTSTSHVTTAAFILLVSQTTLLGAVLGIVAYKTRRLGVNISAHMAFNTISVVLMLISTK